MKTINEIQTELPVMPIYEIAGIVQRDWLKPYFGAVPYIDAMKSLVTMANNYGLDSASDIVCRFLGNAQTWRGPVARLVKAELNKRLKNS